MKTFKFNGKEIPSETILQTREHFKGIYQECIEGAQNKEFNVNNLKEYVEWQNEKIADVMSGNCDHTFWFLQRAYLIMTGVCVPLFK